MSMAHAMVYIAWQKGYTTPNDLKFLKEFSSDKDTIEWFAEEFAHEMYLAMLEIHMGMLVGRIPNPGDRDGYEEKMEVQKEEWRERARAFATMMGTHLK